MSGSVWCTIGAQGPLGTERFLVTGGAVLFGGIVGPAPVSGDGVRFVWDPAKGAIRVGNAAAGRFDEANISAGTAVFGNSCGADAVNSLAFGGGAISHDSGTLAMGTSGSTGGASYSVDFGHYSASYHRSGVARQGARFAANEDAQTSDVRVMRSSVDAAAVVLTLSGAAPGGGQYLAIPPNRTFDFIISCVTYCTAGGDAGKSASWYVMGTIQNTGGTTAIIGSIMNLLATAVFSTVTYTPKCVDVALAAATLVITADDANDALILTFTGVANATPNTFHTVATVYMTEVG